jgi:hypothetical protein
MTLLLMTETGGQGLTINFPSRTECQQFIKEGCPVATQPRIKPLVDLVRKACP